MHSLVDKENFMQMALGLAHKAWQDFDEVPVGAVIVRNNEVLATGLNKKESENCCTRHAEIEAIEKASAQLGSWRLSECSLFVTLEPCVMCAGAIQQARLKNLYFASFDPKGGACGSLYNVLDDERLNHKVETQPGLLQEESSQLLKKFFQSKRKSKA